MTPGLPDMDISRGEERALDLAIRMAHDSIRYIYTSNLASNGVMVQ
jgi:hypothetical protein